jgi:hypothetical protein
MWRIRDLDEKINPRQPEPKRATDITRGLTLDPAPVQAAGKRKAPAKRRISKRRARA